MEIEEGKAISNLKSDPQGAARRRGERRRGRRLLPVTGPQRRGKPSVGRKAGGVNLKVLFFNKKKELRLPFYRSLVLVTFKNLLTDVFLKLKMCS